MLRIYTAVSLLLALAAGLADVLLTTKPATGFDVVNLQVVTVCSPHSVICAGGTAYYWGIALGLAISIFVVLIFLGYPIIIAGRIGKQRNRRGYLAGIFFGWAGLLYIVLRPARSGPDLIDRAVTDYRGRSRSSP